MTRRKRAAAIFGLALAMSIAAAAPAMSTFPGKNGDIAYTAGGLAVGPSGGYEEYTDLFVSGTDGSSLRQLTAGPSLQDLGGAWSPDNSQLIFSRPRPPGSGTPRETLVISADGGTPQDVLTQCGDCSFGSWTPDGTRLIVAAKFAGTLGVYSVAPDGSDPDLRVTAPAGANVQQPVLSPDGTKLAYVLVTGSFPNPATVMVANSDGSGARRIAYGVSPDWSPDSSRLAYASDDPADGHVLRWIMVSDPAGVLRVPVAPVAGWYEDSPSWSPDGSEIIFVTPAYMFAARAPVGAIGQQPGADSPGCVRGFRALFKGLIREPHWGSHHPAVGTAAHPAAVPCPHAPAPPAANKPAALLSTTLTRRSGQLRVRVRLAKGAKGRLTVKATMRHRSLKRRGHVGHGTRRSYRFTVPRAGIAIVTVRFKGRDGWASAHPSKKRIRVRPKAAHS